MISHTDPVEAFDHAYWLATQRAISRQALGLPLDRSANDDELLSTAQVARGMTLDTTKSHERMYDPMAPQHLLLCTRCDDPITDGYMIGDGDGSGRRFAHPECFRQYPGAYKNREPLPVIPVKWLDGLPDA